MYSTMSPGYCKGCVDCVKLGGYWTCDYIGHTGKPRSLICPPGKLCTVKSTRPRELDGEPGTHRWDVKTALDLHKAGANDVEIAAALNVAKETVLRWRKGQGLPANRKQKNPTSRIKWAAEAKELYDMGWSDLKIGREIGVAHQSVSRWRRINGIPANGRCRS